MHGCLWRPEENVTSPRTIVTDHVGHCVSAGSQAGDSQEQPDTGEFFPSQKIIEEQVSSDLYFSILWFSWRL